MKKQRILSLLLALAMVFSLLPANAMAAKTETFTDVSKDDWYYKYVDFVVDKEYFVGTSETTFSPQMSMTRGMFVVVLAAIEGVKVDNNVSPFADVPANTWYSGAVKWAADKGVVAGIGNNKFGPNDPISREQMAVMMDAYVKWHSKKTGEEHKEKSKVDSFKDAAKIASWAAKSVENCRGWGLIAGMPDGNFYPQNTASRAEVATVIYNLVWLVRGGGGGSSSGGHTHTWAAKFNAVNHWEECSCGETRNTTSHSYPAHDCDNAVKCNGCDYEKSAGTHDNTGNWLYDGENHWKECVQCNKIIEKAAHEWDYANATINDDNVTATVPCKVACGETITVEDHIYNAVDAALAELKSKVEDKTNVNVPASGNKDWKDTYVAYSGLTLSPAVKDDTREINIAVTGDIGYNSVKAILRYALTQATNLVYGSGSGSVSAPVSKSDIQQLIEKTVDYLEDRYNINLTMSAASVAELADVIYDDCKNATYNAYDYIKAMNTHFKGDEGYVSGDVKVTAGGYTVTLDVEKNSVAMTEIAAGKDIPTLAASIAQKAVTSLNGTDTEKLANAIENAIKKALDLSETGVNNLDVAKRLVLNTINALEKALGRNVPVADATLNSISDKLVNYTQNKYPVVIQDMETVWDAANTHGNKIAAAAQIAAGVAQDLYADLKSTNDYENLNNIKLAAAISVTFSNNYGNAETAYKNETDLFPYTYIVNVSMQMADMGSETTLGDNVAYKYDNGHYLWVKVTEKAQGVYENALTRIKTRVMNSAYVQNLANSMLGNVTLDKAEITKKANSALGDKMVNILNQLDYVPANNQTVQQFVDSKINAWVELNITDPITDSPMITNMNVGNKPLYDMVDAIAVGFANQVDEMIIARDSSVRNADLEQYRQALTDYSVYDMIDEKLGTTFDAATKAALVEYIVTRSLDILHTNEDGRVSWDRYDSYTAADEFYCLHITSDGVILGGKDCTLADDLLNGDYDSGVFDDLGFMGYPKFWVLNMDVIKAAYLDGSFDPNEMENYTKKGTPAQTDLSTIFCTKSVEDGMKSALNSMMMSTVTDILAESEDVDNMNEAAKKDYEAKMKQLNQITTLMSKTTIKSIENVKFQNLVTGMKSEALHNALKSYDDATIGRLTALIRFIPDEAYLVLPNGKIINEAELSYVRTAKTVGETIDALADVLAKMGDMSLNTFANDQTFVIGYNRGNDGNDANDVKVTFGLKITID